MARLRTVKPEYWTDEHVGQCSMPARLLFIGTWNFADDHGGLSRSAKQLKAQIFPYDNIDCEPLIQELLNAGLLVEYEVDGKKYLHVRGFRKHQKVEKPAAPRIPKYEEQWRSSGNSPNPPGDSPSPRGSSLGIGDETSGVETRRNGESSSLLDESKRCGEMSAALRELSVTVTSFHPTLTAWVRDGFSVDRVREAVAVARNNPGKESGTLAPNYIDRILRQPARPPPERSRAKGAWDRLMEANGGE